jgi:hypothetical protein
MCLKRGVIVGILSNLKKAVKKESSSSHHELGFPKVIDKQVDPADVSKNQGEKPAEAPAEIPQTKPVDIMPFDKQAAAPNTLPEMDDGFFVKLFEDIKEGRVTKEDLADKDLIGQMMDYWSNDESLVKHKSDTEQSRFFIEKSVKETLQRLSNYEAQWKAHKIKYEQLKQQMEIIENEIAGETLKFKELLKKLKLHQPVSLKDTFRLFDGREIKSVTELLGALKIMGDTGFAKHVSGSRNDFSAWIKTALKEPELAERISKVKDRRELIAILQENLHHSTSLDAPSQ